MANKIYKEKQRFSSRSIYVLLALFLGLTVYRLGKELIYPGNQPLAVIGVCTLLSIGLGGLIWYYYNLRLKVTISDKYISYKMKPLHRQKHRITWDNVNFFEIVKTPEIDQWQGGNITFNHERRFSVCGRNGLHLVTKDGKEYFIGFHNIKALKNAIGKLFGRDEMTSSS